MKRSIYNVFLGLVALMLVAGCSEPEDTTKAAAQKPQSAPPEFSAVEDPQQLVDNYLQDLASDKYFPEALLDTIDRGVDLVAANKLIDQHHTLAFIKAYFSEEYLNKIRDIVAEKIKRMEYQLSILDVSAEDATEVLMLTHSGVVPHKKALLAGELAQEWEKKDAQTYHLRLFESHGGQPLRVVQRNGAWKMEFAGY